MTPRRVRSSARAKPEWLAPVALIALAALLYGRGFGVGLVGDDYTLLDAALRTRSGNC